MCRYAMGQFDVQTLLYDDQGRPFKTFTNVRDHLKQQGQNLVFAMNGGMYHDDRSPVGLYIEDYQPLARLNTNKGPGNFHLLPNGVFLIWQEDGFSGAHVMSAEHYKAAMTKEVVRYATQSGPMLVIDGQIHPRFNENGTSKHIRNGVGVDKNMVVFAISDAPVNFHTFARLFKDGLNIDNALYLDGTVSKIYAPQIDRHDIGHAMGPIIVVSESERKE